MAEGRRRSFLAVLLIVVMLMLVGSFGVWRYLLAVMERPGPLETETVVMIPRGSGFSGITAILESAGALEDPIAFRVMSRLTGRDRNLKAGEYEIETHASPNAILDALESGDAILHRITVPEGLTVYEVFEILEKSRILSGELPDVLPAEGSLLPETYLVARDERRSAVIERMSSAMTKTLDELWPNRAPDLPLETKQEALVLASIIEKETSLDDEYPIVAGVFYNRLRRGMRLQTDPTVIYALTNGEGSLGRPLTRADLQVEHDYNTYVVSGLPPGPIANPGREAIGAVLNPVETNYLYFVADGSGGHAFARSLDAHNRNVRNWRRVLAEEQSRAPIPILRPQLEVAPAGVSAPP